VQSIMGLIPMPPGRIRRGSARWQGREILGNTVIDGREIRGREIGMIFQDPMSSLNPTMTIGAQIAETLEIHRGYTRKQAFARAVELLSLTRIPDAAGRARQYPFEFSGGMLQRAMIAAAIACEPSLLIADEPTTALDVTIQAQILDLLNDLKRESGMAIVLITHDLSVVARMADQVAVMYAGEIVEYGTVDDLFYRSAHPYTQGLRAALPGTEPSDRRPLKPIEGSPPDLFHPPEGCAYAARCPSAMKICASSAPPPFDMGVAPGTSRDSQPHFARCWLHHPDREAQS
jgi:oligopeptide/dipeptide ABC transporter ATP-binding protein